MTQVRQCSQYIIITAIILGTHPQHINNSLDRNTLFSLFPHILYLNEYEMFDIALHTEELLCEYSLQSRLCKMDTYLWIP
jgi:hypothetical protein